MTPALRTFYLHDTYVVTGLRLDGRRFRNITTSRLHAFGINLWRGTVWRIVEGRRKCVKRVHNV